MVNRPNRLIGILSVSATWTKCVVRISGVWSGQMSGPNTRGLVRVPEMSGPNTTCLVRVGLYHVSGASMSGPSTRCLVRVPIKCLIRVPGVRSGYQMSGQITKCLAREQNVWSEYQMSRHSSLPCLIRISAMYLVRPSIQYLSPLSMAHQTFGQTPTINHRPFD